MSFLGTKHREEMSPEERAAVDAAEGEKRKAAAVLASMKEELSGQIARMHRAQTEKARLATVDDSAFNGSQRIEHATAVAYADEEVITSADRVAHIVQTIRKVS